MKPDPAAEIPQHTRPVESLTQVLRQNERIKALVEQSAEALSSLTKALRKQIADPEPLPWIEGTLAKCEAVEAGVREASDGLAVVNRALHREARDRELLDHRFAASMEQEEAARRAAFHDVLTGLPNRALFNDRLEHGLAQAKRHGWTLAVMFVDLDEFKDINDSYGHDVGDVVLRTVARRLHESTRGDDTVSRHGGDELLYLLVEIRDESKIASVAEKLLKAIQAPCNISLRGREFSPSIKASIGIAVYPQDGTTPDTLVNSADEAMYRAKQEKSGYAFAQQVPPASNVR